MDMDFRVNEIRNTSDKMYGTIRVDGSKAFCDKIRKICEKEFGEGNIT